MSLKISTKIFLRILMFRNQMSSLTYLSISSARQVAAAHIQLFTDSFVELGECNLPGTV